MTKQDLTRSLSTRTKAGKRQRELMRVLLKKFKDFDSRKQHFYLSNGMSTSHLTLKVIEDLPALHAFWPTKDQKYDPAHGNLYRMGDKTMHSVQSSVLRDIKKLVDQGFIQEFGNEDERRYRPVKELHGVTL